MPKYTPNPLQPELPFDEIQHGYCKCGCGQKTKLAHQSITKYGWIKGEPILFVHGHNQRRPLLDRFWEKTNKNGPVHPTLGTRCWLWTDSPMSSGYGMIGEGHSRILAHRFSYELHFGYIPDDLFVCHRCDVRLCVNPDHLFLGTQADNIKDKEEKGRGNHTVFLRGEESPVSRLTLSQVVEIRQLCDAGMMHREIAKQFGIARSTVTAINRRANWKHI